MNLDWAALPIQLELEDVVWSSDRATFTARHGVHPVRFAQKRKRITIETTLRRPVPFDRAVAFDAHPAGGRVFSGHPDFDREVWVTAKPWNAEGTDHVLANAAVRSGLLALIALGGSATADRLSVSLETRAFAPIKSAIHTLLALATALALFPHERQVLRKLVRIDERSETAVDEWAKDRFRLHNAFVTPSTFEVDLKAGTVQVPPGAPMRVGVYFVHPLPELGQATLECQGRKEAICRGRLKSVDSLADALARLGLDVLV